MPEVRTVFSSSLDRVRAASVLQLAESESCTGFIKVGDHGRIDLRRGQVVGARARPDLEGRVAVVELLTTTDGAIELVEDTSVLGEPLARIVNLVMDGARLADEWAELDTSPWRYRDEVPRSARDATLARVLDDVARGATIDQATRRLGLARTVVRDRLRRAVDDALVVAFERASRATAAPAALGASGRSIDMSRADQITKLIKTLATNTPDVEASAVIDNDGLMIASALAADVDDESVAAMSAALLGIAERIVRELGRGEFEMVMTRGSQGYVVLVRCGRDAVLTVLTSNAARIGLIFLDLRRAATEVAKLLG